MNRWDRRIERAQVLEREYPAAVEFLSFYREIARFQKQVAEALPAVSASSPVFALNPAEIADPVRRHADALLALVQRVAPPDLAQTAALLAQLDVWDPADSAVQFITRVLLQPYAEHLARGALLDQATAASICSFCGEPPVAAVLRPEGEGGKRSLVCSLCSTEWHFRRLLCPKCGEEDQHKLPIYTAEPYPHVRIEACDTCRTYLKSIDMTINGLAVPEVDELASVPLDLWAAENHYTKLKTNLFGL
ncbi:MAG TPA: formate dehydrogenase accessory protein FdhE [Bryobacteraceae bacterium]|jgi:FdhE protein|nr:formate dehydrogenase accessory protein FdhE [Bryobacteraceae bacterium]